MSQDHVRSYEEEMGIDCSALDVEWLEQPRLMMKYGRQLADARRAQDDAKEFLDYTKAKLDNEIRQDPDSYGLAKATETAVAGAILLQDEYREASSALIQAKYDTELLSTAVRAVDSRKTALENLVRLHGMSYFAGPAVPRDLAAEREKHTEKLNQDANQRVRIARRRKE